MPGIFPVITKDLHTGSADIDLWIAQHVMQLCFEPRGFGDVIAIHAGNIGMFCYLYAMIQGGDDAAGRRIQQHNPGVRSQSLQRVVGAMVIDDHEFKYHSGLPQYGLNCRREVTAAIVNRHHYTNAAALPVELSQLTQGATATAASTSGTAEAMAIGRDW